MANIRTSLGRAGLWVVCALALGCSRGDELTVLSVQPAVGPSGSLVAYGECDVPDGVMVLVHARGGESYGGELEAAILTPVMHGRFAADLGLHEPLPYRVTVTLSSALNPAGRLPAKAPLFHDTELTQRETSAGWEIARQADFRVGSPDEANRYAGERLQKLSDALKILQRFAASLREIEQRNRAAELARWYRLYWENRRDTSLAAPGLEPLYPTLHTQLREADETLQRRFHAVLAALTGATDETDRLAADWPLVQQRLRKLEEDLSALQAKLAP